MVLDAAGNIQTDSATEICQICQKASPFSHRFRTGFWRLTSGPPRRESWATALDDPDKQSTLGETAHLGNYGQEPARLDYITWDYERVPGEFPWFQVIPFYFLNIFLHVDSSR